MQEDQTKGVMRLAAGHPVAQLFAVGASRHDALLRAPASSPSLARIPGTLQADRRDTKQAQVFAELVASTVQRPSAANTLVCAHVCLTYSTHACRMLSDGIRHLEISAPPAEVSMFPGWQFVVR